MHPDSATTSADALHPGIEGLDIGLESVGVRDVRSRRGRLVMAGEPSGAFCHGRLHDPAVFRRDVRNPAYLLRLNARSIPLDNAA